MASMASAKSFSFRRILWFCSLPKQMKPRFLSHRSLSMFSSAQLAYNEVNGRRHFCSLPTETTTTPTGSSLDASFTPEQTNKILECFNIWPAESLNELKYFGQQKAENIVVHREHHGHFEKISDLQAVPGFGVLGLKNICKAILDNQKKVPKLPKTTKRTSTASSVCYPKLSLKKSQSVNEVMSLDLQHDRVSWVHMDRDMSVIDWHQTVIFDHPPIRYDHAVWHHKISEALSRLPEADVYLLENKVYRYPSLRIVPVIVALRMMEAIIITLLNKDYQATESHNVFTIKPHTIAGHFYLCVGGERVSGQHIVRDIINKASNLASHVTVPNEQADYFLGLDHQHQESLSRALLLGILFCQEVIFPARDTVEVTDKGGIISGLGS